MIGCSFLSAFDYVFTASPIFEVLGRIKNQRKVAVYLCSFTNELIYYHMQDKFRIYHVKWITNIFRSLQNFYSDVHILYYFASEFPKLNNLNIF